MTTPTFLLLLLLATFLRCFTPCSAFGIAAPRMLFLVQQQQPVLEYHNGLLLKGEYALNLIWYGDFTPAQRAIVSDFVLSFNPAPLNQQPPPPPSVATWWNTVDGYLQGGSSSLTLGSQFLLQDYHLGKSLNLSQIEELASGGTLESAINVVLTSADVIVEGFCSSSCGQHGSFVAGKGQFPYIWVGNSGIQCPGQCAWPFAQPLYGPQTPPLKAPNDDVGVDGMIINLATLLAGTVTNPFDGGYFQGPPTGPQEAVSVCTGMFGKGSYPGNPGAVPVEQTSGASYNARGLFGRLFLLPGMWDPKTSQCTTLV